MNVKIKFKLEEFLKSQIFLYLVFGVLTTVVSLTAFWIFRRLGISLDASVVLSWILSVLFAFLTNRKFVFHSESKNFLKELFLFFSARIFSGVVEFLMMHFLSKANFINEVVLKFFVGVVVTILNFILSKLIVFRKAKIKGESK